MSRSKWAAAGASVLALALAPGAAMADGPGSLVGQLQAATNNNKTEQSASSEAKTTQTNVAIPVSLLSEGSGNVKQSNEGSSTAKSNNDNNTQQANDQTQNGGGCGPLERVAIP
jgi:hypothetical protein